MKLSMNAKFECLNEVLKKLVKKPRSSYWFF